MQLEMCRKLRCVVLAMMIVAACSGAALATDDAAKGAARELASEAKRDFDAGRFEEAGRKFQRAYEIAKVPTLAVWAARALAKRGQLVAASELYRQALHLTANDLWVGNAQQQAQTDAEKELAELQPRIPRLRVRVEGAAANGVGVTIDDVKLASALYGIEIPADPGRRRIVGRKGAETAEQTIDLGEGERKEAVLKFNASTPAQALASLPLPTPATAVAQAGQDGSLAAPTPTLSESAASPSRARRTWGWVAVGVGTAGLLTGAVTGIIVLSDSSLRSDCPNNACDPSKVGSGRVSTYNLMRYASPVGFIVGAVGAAVGIPLLLWTQKHESEPRMALWLGPGSAGVKGAF